MKKKSLLPIKLGAVAGLFLLMGIIYLIYPSFFTEFWDVCLSGDMYMVAEYINSFGSWAVVFGFFLILLVNSIGFPPAIIFSSASALIFGLIPGILLAWIAETVGVAISFVLLRFLFRDAAEEAIAKNAYLQKIDEMSGSKGFQIMLVARIIPYLPSGLLNILGAISKMSFKAFVLAALIGKLPSTAIEATIGHDAVSSDDPTRLIIMTAIALIMVVGYIIYEKRKIKKRNLH